MTLTVQSISKRYDGAAVLQDASITIRDGEFVALLGPSGSGKTTLLNVISGLVQPDAGQLLLDGRDITALPAGARRFGMVFQSYALFRHMTVAQNIGFGLQVLPRGDRLDKAGRAAKVRELLAMIEMPDLGDRYPAQLSGGQQQRVAMARALAIDPALLLLDEPFSALDAKVRHSLRGSVRDLQRRVGVAAILVTHDQAEAFEVADRIAVMNGGRIEQIGTPEELRAAPATPFVQDFLTAA
ncbi:ABC transporter ATP-binding protein [Pseudoroseicyclus aestuarii]|uniref:Sulfate transport system ATP-binding protein n=1 Tax=Pseudoroseicyclus aestuarii TaxID=1795041 RepID=A0A318SVW9_9RHOB|nr:ATP-binding cassette domain-containing protein [Pseudoroseicyclus aestuarii]PYE84496.1 sulfate transport system ATP-binding protein [Pseudoroseicyclus aestuarii]